MKKILSTIITMIIVVTLMSSNVYAKVLPRKEKIATDKVWKVNFSVPIDAKTVTPENIYIKEKSTGNIIKSRPSLDETGKIIYVKSEKAYKSNTEYLLIITKNIKSVNSIEIDDEYLMEFVTESGIAIPDTNMDIDTDGDGLSDYQEVHKYFSNPNKKDTDDDGILDNDMNERTENTYTIKTTMRIKKPYNLSVMNDNYQDVTLKEETSDYGVFDIVLYPCNTNDVKSNYNWKEYVNNPELQQYLKPTITANWDEELKTKIITDLKDAGIDIENSTYKGTKIADDQIVEKVANYLLKNTKFLDEFTTYYVSFPNGVPTIDSTLQSAFQRDKGNPQWSIQQQFDNELFGKQMYMNKQHGSCTSTAILWETVYRAIGIPCRMILTVPIIDGNDKNQKAMLSNITDVNIASTVKQGANGATGFSAHTYNEVFVGNRWVRLNYNKLNQNIIDKNYFGAMIHINTFGDLSESNLNIWGERYALRTQDSFKYSNPYETLNVKSENGSHSKIVVNKPKKVNEIFVDKFMTYTSTEVPAKYRGRKTGVILMKINGAENGVK